MIKFEVNEFLTIVLSEDTVARMEASASATGHRMASLWHSLDGLDRYEDEYALDLTESELFRLWEETRGGLNRQFLWRFGWRD